MPKPEENITQLTPEHRLFLLDEEDLSPNFFGRHRVQVAHGSRWLVYRDGLLCHQFDPGPHSWWNGFLHKWKAQVINTRVELLHIEVKGRVKGPPIPRDAPGAANVDLACEVTAELEISSRLVDIENFLQYRDPLSVFLASLQNMVIEFIGHLPYDQYGQWATELRDQVTRRLKGGRDDAERRVGIRVEDIFVTEFRPNTAHDRNMLAMYQTVERARRELVDVQSKAERDQVSAISYAQQGELLNIAPSILALQNSPVGQALIDRDADLRELLVASGLNPGVNVQPIQDATGQVNSGQAPAIGYLNPPPRPTSPSTGQFQGGHVSSNLYTSDEFNTLVQPSQPLEEQRGAPVAPARQNLELAALEQAGFMVAGRGQEVPAYDEAGRPAPGSKEWVLQVSWRHRNGPLVIVFHCPTGYPEQPPKVQMKAPTGGGLRWVQPNNSIEWNMSSTLAKVAQEIVENTP